MLTKLIVKGYKGIGRKSVRVLSDICGISLKPNFGVMTMALRIAPLFEGFINFHMQ